MSRVWRVWERFTIWFDQTHIQLIYSGIAFLGGIGFIVSATRFGTVLGIVLIITAILNISAVLSKRSSSDAADSDRD